MKKKILVVLCIFSLTTWFATQCNTVELSLSDMIVKTFLEKLKERVKEDAGGREPEAILFGGHHPVAVELHDMRIELSREVCGGEGCVILSTHVHGMLEDFERDPALRHEKKLLKFMLLKAYREQKELQEDRIGTIIDDCTKVVWHPDFLVKKTNIFLYYGCEEKCTDRKGMIFETYFSIEEFDSFLQKYFV